MNKNTETISSTKRYSNGENFLVGFSNAIYGSDITPDVESCLDDFALETADITKILADLKLASVAGLEMALRDALAAVSDINSVLDKCEDAQSDDPLHQETKINGLIEKYQTLATLLINYNKNKAAFFANLYSNRDTIQTYVQNNHTAIVNSNYVDIGYTFGQVVKVVMTGDKKVNTTNPTSPSNKYDTESVPVHTASGSALNDLDQFLLGLGDGFENNNTGEFIKNCRLEGTALVESLLAVYTEYKAHPTAVVTIIELLGKAIKDYETLNDQCLKSQQLTDLKTDLTALQTKLKEYYNNVVVTIENYNKYYDDVDTESSDLSKKTASKDYHGVGYDIGGIVRMIVLGKDSTMPTG